MREDREGTPTQPGDRQTIIFPPRSVGKQNVAFAANEQPFATLPYWKEIFLPDELTAGHRSIRRIYFAPGLVFPQSCVIKEHVGRFFLRFARPMLLSVARTRLYSSSKKSSPWDTFFFERDFISRLAAPTRTYPSAIPDLVSDLILISFVSFAFHSFSAR